MAKIAIAVSGGVDSLGALLSLRQAGHDVLAVHGLFLANAEIPPELSQTCQKAGAEFVVADLRSQFRQAVIEYFEKEYAKGRTPNPCALCNRAIKFGYLLEFALAQGADKFATGHYAALDNSRYETPMLGQCLDTEKDQAYFLALVNAENLKSVLFPLEGQTKSQTRQKVAAGGITPLHPSESQDICFLARYPRRGCRFQGRPGPVLLRTEKDGDVPLENLPEIGRHNGLGNYTAGQRRGLGLSWREPLYVRELDVQTNALVVSPRRMLEIWGVELEELNFFIDPENWAVPLFARLRYRQPLLEANIDFSGGKVKIWLKMPCFSTAPGQIAAIYDQAGHILAGGIIGKILYSSDMALIPDSPFYTQTGLSSLERER
ncbi:MAG: tRNA-specific 2-thiouridylase [Desulfovibrio sp.]|nr:tRNA-specific 2-thiouridylase [Desulfovibrio sp.]